MTDIKADRAIAEAATPGPWDYYLEQGYEGNGAVITYTEDEKGMRTIGETVFKRLYTSEENKLFIATFNPTKILSLLEEIEEARKVIEFYADRKTWSYDFQTRGDIGKEIDHTDIDLFNPGKDIWLGGKRARAFLERFKK